MTEIRNGYDWPRKKGWNVYFRDEEGKPIPESEHIAPHFIPEPEPPNNDFGRGIEVAIPIGAVRLVISPTPARCLSEVNGLLCEKAVGHEGSHLALQAVWE